MRYLFILLLLSCTCTVFGQPPVKLENDDQKEIRYQARRKIEHDLKDLLNTLSFEEVGDAERKDLIRNSYLPGPNQLFYDDGVVIEDDVNPERFDFTNIRDAGVAEYLNNFDLFYKKTPEPSIIISNIVVAPEVQTKEYPFIKVYFTSQFKGKYSKAQTPYRPTQRVAEFRIEKKGAKWYLFITSLAFYNPEKDQTNLTANASPPASASSLKGASATDYKMLALDSKRLRANHQLYMKKSSTFRKMGIIFSSAGVLFTGAGTVLAIEASKADPNSISYDNLTTGGALLIVAGLGAGTSLSIIGFTKSKSYKRKAMKIREELIRRDEPLNSLRLQPSINPFRKSGQLTLSISF
jgi:hypothetical protein